MRLAYSVVYPGQGFLISLRVLLLDLAGRQGLHNRVCEVVSVEGVVQCCMKHN